MIITDRFRRKKHEKDTAAQNNRDDVFYRALTPASDIQNGKEYISALDWALEQDDIRNIAISGPYGSGKSSVINTYFKTRKHKDVLPISLAAFNLENMPANEDDRIDDELEIGILKQLFYRVRADKIPKSRYRKLQPDKCLENTAIGIFVEILLLVLLYFAFPDKVNVFVTSVMGLPNCLRIVSFIVVFIVLWCMCFVAVKWFRRSGSVQEIKILDKATLKNGDINDNESVFNKYMDEIVYFFEETGYRIVVIEDLDRFESTNIFVALRELNNLLNHYEGIKEKVTFIYAIKDDMFQKEGERTKFFDFIIPVVPYISSMNSGEVLRSLLHFDDEKNESSLYEISGQYISLISPYISDMRDLICICNEFIVFKNTLKGNQRLNLNDTQMFSLIVFKNLYPKDFAQLEEEKDDSIVRRAFYDRKVLIAKREELFKTKQQEQEEVIRKVDQEVLKNVRDIKIALLMCLMNYNSWVISISVGNKNYSYTDILADEFDIDVLKKKQLSIAYMYQPRYYANSMSIDDIEKRVKDNGGDYFERLDRVTKGLDKCKENAKEEIEKYERLLNELRTYSISQMINEFGTEFLSEKVRENDLLVFLLRNGFIDDNYADYINYFHPNSITKDEMNFILAVRNHKSDMDYTYSLLNVSQVFDRLQDYEFQQREILNYDLVDYVLEEKTGTSEEKYLMDQLSNHTPESMAFIKAYIDRGRNVDTLIRLLCHINNQLWVDICNDTGISLETRFMYLRYMLTYATIEDIVLQDKVESNEGILTEFFKNHSDVLERLKEVSVEKLIQVIDALGLVFNDLEIYNLDEQLKQYVFDNSCYVINETMLYRLTEWKEPKLVDELKLRNYTTIRAMGYQPLIDYIHREFNSYISDIVLGIDSNTEENNDAIDDLINRLCPEHIELALSVLEKERVTWEHLECCCTSASENGQEYKQTVWKFLLDNNKITCTWENVETYYREYGADGTWLAYVVRNIDELVYKAEVSNISDDIRQKLIFEDLSEGAFRKVITGVYKELYSDTLSKLNPMKIQVLIEEQKLPFKQEYWDELYKVAPGLRVLYAVKNGEVFIQSLDNIVLTGDEVNQMLEGDAFNNEQKERILGKLAPNNMTIATARILRNLTGHVPKEYIVIAWKLLPDDDKYKLLLNHMDVYQNNELPMLFGQLSSEYQQFVERTRHKFTLGFTEYNKLLLEKLKGRDYITSVEEQIVEKLDKSSSSGKKEHVLIGYVKQAK